jgi:CelD/BcsL family acetyltransferase involved in cellulose biosynthesis
MMSDTRVGGETPDELGARLDDLHQVTAAPITARRPWLQAWVDSYPQYSPLSVTVVGAGGQFEAAALLATIRRRGISRIVPVGHGPTDEVMFPARTDAAADLLVEAVVEQLARIAKPWRLEARQVTSLDRFVSRLVRRHPRAEIHPGVVSPQLIAGADRSLHAYVSAGHRKNIQRIRNRMTRHQLEPVVKHLQARDDVIALLPELERIMHARDESLGRRSVLDDESERSFFRRVVERHAGRDEVSLTTLELSGRLAAFALCFLDRDAVRMWHTRFDPEWSRYSAGKLAMDEAVAHALASGCAAFDFMRGEEHYKASYANHSKQASDLYAWSGSLIKGHSRVVLGLRTAAYRVEARGGRPAAWVAAAKQQVAKVRTP